MEGVGRLLGSGGGAPGEGLCLVIMFLPPVAQLREGGGGREPGEMPRHLAPRGARHVPRVLDSNVLYFSFHSIHLISPV